MSIVLLNALDVPRRIEKRVIAKDWDMLTEEDFAQIQNSSYQIESFRKHRKVIRKDGFRSYILMI